MISTRSSTLCLLALLAAPMVRAADCPASSNSFAPVLQRARVAQLLSANAEAVAPSSAGGKRRSVGPPANVERLPVANFIDTHIGAKLYAARISPAALSGDEEFLRRVMIDLTGAIPTPAEVTAFVNDPSPDKRARTIDALLRSDAFVDRLTMWFGDLVENVQIARNTRIYYLGSQAYHAWMRNAFRANQPYDAMVRELLAGEGRSFSNPTANYVLRQISSGPPEDSRDNIATHSFEKFLGIPLMCISCHDGAWHLETVNWYLRGKTRNDFYRMAAFFAQTSLGSTSYVDPEHKNVFSQGLAGYHAAGQYRLDTTEGNKSPRIPAPGQPAVATPAFLTTGEVPREGERYRVAYGRMLTAERQFARATANYLWKEMFGLALVEPVNSFDLAKLSEQTLHPELLEAMTDEVLAKGYSLREVIRTIALSNTYQLSTRYTHGGWNESWVPYYPRRYPRRLHAEVLLDAITTATGVPVSLPVQGKAPVSKAMQLPDPLEGGRFTPTGRFLDSFGRGNRDDNFRNSGSTIAQALGLLNAPFVLSRVKRTAPGSTVGRILAATGDPGEIADQLYLATLSRKPTPIERQKAAAYLAGGSLDDRAEDLQFALLNTLEFLFQ
ncbi:MAG TPA: DUF1549 domain-containing protein [Thermoanaerobaculia bacterium]|nr:DUF1549 domain-containing protein [Thermoanaerobaculia bacterium]